MKALYELVERSFRYAETAETATETETSYHVTLFGQSELPLARTMFDAAQPPARLYEVRYTASADSKARAGAGQTHYLAVRAKELIAEK